MSLRRAADDNPYGTPVDSLFTDPPDDTKVVHTNGKTYDEKILYTLVRERTIETINIHNRKDDGATYRWHHLFVKLLDENDKEIFRTARIGTNITNDYNGAHTIDLREYKFNDMILKVSDKSIKSNSLPEVNKIIIKANDANKLNIQEIQIFTEIGVNVGFNPILNVLNSDQTNNGTTPFDINGPRYNFEHLGEQTIICNGDLTQVQRNNKQSDDRGGFVTITFPKKIKVSSIRVFVNPGHSTYNVNNFKNLQLKLLVDENVIFDNFDSGKRITEVQAKENVHEFLFHSENRNSDGLPNNVKYIWIGFEDRPTDTYLDIPGIKIYGGGNN